ncbi:MAG: acetyltransferase [Opitutaceae bacterium]|jgi:acetyltransferase-like isoleucine patch superfamily enzyme|nr:acetyltransferase [Opitutaceae bacterium]
MSFWTWIDGGESMPANRTWRQRLALRFGHHLAVRHGNVFIDPTARISPDARIHPRAGELRIGARCTVGPGVILQGNVTLGDDSSIQAGSIIIGYGNREDRAGQITIGNKVRIAPFVQMIAGNHNFDDITRPIHDQGVTPAPITVEDDCWIAGRTVLTSGVTVHTGAVVAAGAVVTKDVPARAIVGGIPARVIRLRGPAS